MKKNWLTPEIDELTITATAGRGGRPDSQSPVQNHPENWTPSPAATAAVSFDSASGGDIATKAPSCTSVPISRPHWPWF